jgi:hypothetical protein
MRQLPMVLAAGLALGGAALGWSLADRPAQAQMMGGSAPIHVSATAVGTGSHAWAIDPRTSQVIFCTSTTGGKPACTATPLPGSATR